jgi:glycosyltransferase involved in cell wall biosynthesis
MEKSKKLISIVTPCYNEEENVGEIYEATKQIMTSLKTYSYEHIFIDNASKDRTVQILRKIASADKNAKIIVNSRDFGQVRSPFYGMLQAKGDAVILMAADFQEPPYLIPELVKRWEQGYKIVKAIKTESEESRRMFWVRKMFYNLISKLSEVELTKNYTGFGLYDKQVMEVMKQIDDPYPYLRGLVSEIGFEYATVKYTQPKRKKGVTKNNFYLLYDIAINGITHHSKVPLRLATALGFVMSALSLLLSVTYLVLKLVFWYSFPMGTAPILIGIFFFSSIQLFFIGVLGEYIGQIYTQVRKRPLVIEKERINFD